MKQIQVKLIVISLLIIAISLAVIAFRPVVKDIQTYVHRKWFRMKRPIYQLDPLDQWLKDQWLEKHK